MATTKIRKIPLHRKVKYLLNDPHWAGFMADHYFAKTAAANKSCDAAGFDQAVSQMDITLDEFLGRGWV
tara:strand:+ start:1382 stop:1588 length:207 start_codon:yes stop_codon:yes gene_type:complete